MRRSSDWVEWFDIYYILLALLIIYPNPNIASSNRIDYIKIQVVIPKRFVCVSSANVLWKMKRSISDYDIQHFENVIIWLFLLDARWRFIYHDINYRRTRFERMNGFLRHQSHYVITLAASIKLAHFDAPAT
jgi:hypothetical protein